MNALAANQSDSAFAERWQAFYADATERTRRLVAENPVTETIATLAELHSGDVHVSNGSAIRYAQMVEWPYYASFMCNRGISGIDGCTSTALGAVLVSHSPTLLITGDMSAAYDIGALGVAEPPQAFRIAVLDNAGGDIFRNITATAALPELDRYFVVQPRLPLRLLAEAYGYRYLEYDCGTPDRSVLEQFIKGRGPAILRIIIDPKYTARLL